ncbi:peptidoglycan DD-metalloendopeptidase family protein [uncultured Alistipes sp.]|uniref:peptidoglycan DD-metalloendopeptidase family protein n=1 Tax=uncultured Alistipes sp. TaxID=538949 RepID=UPI0028050C74|nr:peptidoglycan DD-metalloendopeptidase family protein [uncultured Alistipes sp.]
MKQLRLTFCALALLATASCDRNQTTSAEEAEAETLHDIRYGIIADDYRLEEGEVAQGETMGKILNRYGISAVAIDRLDKASEKTFPLRNIRAGQKYVAFIHEDSLFAPHLDYLAYERSLSDYVVFGFHGDSVSVRTGEKEFTTRRTKKSAVISSSLWGSIMEKNLPYALAAELEDIYQWTVDFFGIQKGDSFTVIYDERFIDDSVSVGIGRIWGARFDHGGKEYYAIPFRQGGKIQYWEADGGSLRKQMLKAPLKYTRISSKFTYARKHPIYKVYRPHTGVDYAAPKGTPVHAVADGVVVFKGWGGGGGNTLKIKHPGNMMTGYLHLSGFAKGIAQGKHVTQGQLIGYVGSTGASTGPHLDYRVWRNGKPINPLTIPQEPSEPISKDNRAEFEFIRDRIMAELNGDVPAEERIVQLDSIVIPEGFVARELGTPAGKEQKSEAAKAQSGTKKS